MEAFTFVELAVGAVGVMVIVWGVFTATIEFVVLEVRRARGINICH